MKRWKRLMQIRLMLMKRRMITPFKNLTDGWAALIIFVISLIAGLINYGRIEAIISSLTTNNDTSSVSKSSIPFEILTTENVTNIELGYALTGGCGAFSLDDKLIATSYGVNNIVSGVRRFPTNGASTTFSPTGNLLFIGYDGIYEILTGKRVLILSDFADMENYYGSRPGGNAVFSPDEKLVAVDNIGIFHIPSYQRYLDIKGDLSTFSSNGKYIAFAADAIYDIDTGNRKFLFEGYSPTFSPNGNFLAVTPGGLYSVVSERRLFYLPEGHPAFSPDEKLVAIAGYGAYDTSTGDILFRIGGSPRYSAPQFSPDGTLLAVGDDGVYDVKSGRRLFLIDGYYPNFSPNGELLATYDSLYAVTGQKLFEFPGYFPSFNREGNLVAVNHTLDESRDDNCLIYGIPTDNWPFRSAIGWTYSNQGINVYNSPNGQIQFQASGSFVILARSQNNDWLRISSNAWIEGNMIRFGDIPLEVPVE